jgi:PEP-CTERM motif
VSQSLTPLSPGSYPLPAVYLNDVIGNSYPYDFSVPLSFINLLDAGSPLEIELHNLTSASAYDGLVSAVTFNDYGDNWSLLAVPEPATWVLLVSGLAIAIVLRRRNYRLLIVSRRSEWRGQIVGDLR